MTPIAEKCCSKAVEEGHAAAKLTFPVNVLRAVLRACIRANTHLLHQTRLAYHIFLPICIFDIHLRCAVLQASKVWLVALVAHVEDHFVVDKAHWVIVVEFTGCRYSWIIEQVLLFGDFHGFYLQLGLKLRQLEDLFVNFIDMISLDRLFAFGTVHEGELYS